MSARQGTSSRFTYRWDQQSPTTILLDVAHPGMPIIAGAVRRVRLQHKADPPVLNSRRKHRRDVNTNNVILMDLSRFTKQSGVTSCTANCGSSDPVLLGNTSYAGRSQISCQLAKAITPESVNGGSLIETATVRHRPPDASGAE